MKFNFTSFAGLESVIGREFNEDDFVEDIKYTSTRSVINSWINLCNCLPYTMIEFAYHFIYGSVVRLYSKPSNVWNYSKHFSSTSWHPPLHDELIVMKDTSVPNPEDESSERSSTESMKLISLEWSNYFSNSTGARNFLSILEFLGHFCQINAF